MAARSSFSPALQPSPTQAGYAERPTLDHPGFGSSSDEALLWRIGTADGRALADLYQRHADTARALAHRMLYDRDEAEDVVQDVFLTLWHRPHHFDPERGTGRAWLLTVVRNRTRDHLRRRMPRGDVTELADLLPDSDLVDALDELDSATRRELLWRQVDKLPPEQAALIQRAYADGQTHQEISTETGLPLGTVKSRIRLGLDKLRSALRADLSF
jgi:RNA polymerase sigma-70 factor, ECF subfamily